jgi:glutaredoxin
MLKVYGTKDCSRCVMVKKRLDLEQHEYEYVLLEDLPKDQEMEIRKKARENKFATLPLLVRDGEFITMQEL